MLMLGNHGSSVSWNGVLNGRVREPSGPNSLGCGSSNRSNDTRVFRMDLGPIVRLWSPGAGEWFRGVGRLSLRSAGGGSEFSDRFSEPQLALLLKEIRCRGLN